MGFALPPVSAGLASRMFERAGAKALSDTEAAAKLASRFDELSAKASKGALSTAERAEHAELKQAVGELEKAGWKPREGAGAKKDTGQSSFTEAKKGKGSNITGFIDGVQNWVDGATLAGGVAGMAMTAGVVTAPVGAATTVASDVAGLVNAGVDVVQAGVAAAQGDFKEAGEQLMQAGGRALGAIPYVGTVLRGASKGAKVAEAGAKATSAATKAAGMSDDAVKAFAKEMADHPAFTDLAFLGSKFKGATLETIADPKAVRSVAELAEKIRKGETSGSTLARYKKGDEGVNDFLHDVAAKFSKTPEAKLTAEAIGELGPDTAKLLGKAGAPLTESLTAALSSGKLAAKDLPAVRAAAQTLDTTGNSLVREAYAASMKKALGAAGPGKAVAEVSEKVAMLEKVAIKQGTNTSSLATKLTEASNGNQVIFREALEALTDPRVSTKGLQAALGKPELLSGLTSKAGIDRLISEARRMSI